MRTLPQLIYKALTIPFLQLTTREYNDRNILIQEGIIMLKIGIPLAPPKNLNTIKTLGCWCLFIFEVIIFIAMHVSTRKFDEELICLLITVLRGTFDLCFK
jgi:hypothetical protein